MIALIAALIAVPIARLKPFSTFHHDDNLASFTNSHEVPSLSSMLHHQPPLILSCPNPARDTEPALPPFRSLALSSDLSPLPFHHRVSKFPGTLDLQAQETRTEVLSVNWLFLILAAGKSAIIGWPELDVKEVVESVVA